MTTNPDVDPSTATSTAAEERGRRLARRMSLVNPVMRAVLLAPFPTPLSRRLMLAYITGRRTGRHYLQPLSYVRYGHDLLTPGGGRWTKNIMDDRPVLLRVKGRDITARPELVQNPAEVEELLDAISTVNPAAARFIPLPRTADGQIEPLAFKAALDHGFGIVRWHTTTAP